MKLVFLAALAVVSIGVVLSCAPHTAYIKQYQMMHSGNKCVQCQEIIVHTSCTNNWHDTQFGCATPVVEYGLEPTGRCGQASMVCVPDATRPGASSVMIVALVDNSDGRFGQNAQVYAPISNMGVSSATVIEPCSMESAWMHDSLDDLPLANPLQIQCATNVAGFVLPPMEERYQMKQVAQPSPSVQALPQTAPETYERSEVQTAEVQPVEVQPAEGHVVDEDVQVIILGTTLMPYVKERVVQRVIKEHHLYPRLHKKIVKTKHISKPTAFEREYIERVPATKIVPTFEERRATQIIRGTTLVPMVEEMEVTEMLPEITEAPYVEQAKYVEEKVPQPVVVESGYGTTSYSQQVQPSGYENAPQPRYEVQETHIEDRPSNGYEAPAPAAVLVEEHRPELSTQPQRPIEVPQPSQTQQPIQSGPVIIEKTEPTEVLPELTKTPEIERPKL